MFKFKTKIGAVLLCFLAGLVQAQDMGSPGKIDIEAKEKWRTVFGGREAIYHFHIRAVESISGRVGWVLRHKNRTIDRGESLFKAGPVDQSLIKVGLNIPQVKEGVIMPLRFALTLYSKTDKQVLASWEETLYVFHEDAFAIKKEWLKNLKIGLFDPEGKTQAVFKAMKIPFLVQKNIDSLSKFNGSLLIIGSGLNFAKYQSLWKEILSLSIQNTPVLVLAPSAGSILIPGVKGTELPECRSMMFLGREVICQLYNKLDADAWAPDGKVVASSMVLNTVKSRLVGEFVSEDKDWSWFEADFTGKGGRIVICGFAIVEQMDAGPTPRFLLARLFEYLSGDTENKIEIRKLKGDTR